MSTFETSVRIGRPIEDVFALVSDPLQFPRWNSAVRTVQLTSGRTGELGSTYSMERELPTGQAENELEVFARNHPSEFGIRTTSGATPFVYRYRFASERGATVVRLDAKVELPGVAPVLGPLAARGVRRGVNANFAALKRILEEAAGDAGSSFACREQRAGRFTSQRGWARTNNAWAKSQAPERRPPLVARCGSADAWGRGFGSRPFRHSGNRLPALLLARPNQRIAWPRLAS